jgi:GTP pyrophosphokinase
MNNLDLISRAVKMAALAHKGQERKGGAPYVSHPIIVGFILSQYGFDAETIAAGILHDVIEDTSTTKEDIVRDFGSAVAETVVAWSENASLPWVQRKADLVEQIRVANPSAFTLSAI